MMKFFKDVIINYDKYLAFDELHSPLLNAGAVILIGRRNVNLLKLSQVGRHFWE